MGLLRRATWVGQARTQWPHPTKGEFGLALFRFKSGSGLDFWNPHVIWDEFRLGLQFPRSNLVPDLSIHRIYSILFTLRKKEKQYIIYKYIHFLRFITSENKTKPKNSKKVESTRLNPNCIWVGNNSDWLCIGLHPGKVWISVYLQTIQVGLGLDQYPTQPTQAAPLGLFNTSC